MHGALVISKEGMAEAGRTSSSKVLTLVQYEKYIVNGGKLSYVNWLRNKYDGRVQSWDVAEKVEFPKCIARWVRTKKTDKPMAKLNAMTDPSYDDDKCRLAESIVNAKTIDDEIAASSERVMTPSPSEPRTVMTEIAEVERQGLDRDAPKPNYVKYTEVTPVGWRQLYDALRGASKAGYKQWKRVPTKSEVLGGEAKDNLSCLYSFGALTASRESSSGAKGWHPSERSAVESYHNRTSAKAKSAAASISHYFPDTAEEAACTTPAMVVRRFMAAGPAKRQALMEAGNAHLLCMAYHVQPDRSASSGKAASKAASWSTKELGQIINRQSYDYASGSGKASAEFRRFMTCLSEGAPRSHAGGKKVDMIDACNVLATVVSTCSAETVTTADIHELVEYSTLPRERHNLYAGTLDFSVLEDEDVSSVGTVTRRILWRTYGLSYDEFATRMPIYGKWKATVDGGWNPPPIPEDVDAALSVGLFLAMLPIMSHEIDRAGEDGEWNKTDMVVGHRQAAFILNGVMLRAAQMHDNCTGKPVPLSVFENSLAQENSAIRYTLWNYGLSQNSHIAQLYSITVIGNAEPEQVSKLCQAGT